MNLIFKIIQNPYRLFARLIIERARFLSDKAYLNIVYRACFGKPINWENPQTYNEKLQWLKLYDRNPLYTTLVDKYEVKKYVAERIGEEHVIPTLGIWERFDDIDFDALPNQFVLKCTHDSGGLVIVKDKTQFDIEAARKKIEASLKVNYYWKSREWPYKNVKPRIIAEQYMTDGNGGLSDYKVHTFNGVPRIVLTCRNRFSEAGMTEDFFTEKWEHLDLHRPFANKGNGDVKQPEQLSKMLSIAEDLSKGIAFLRTDFYLAGGKVYVGELTFFPASGMKGFIPEDWDKKMGDWLILPIPELGGAILRKDDMVIIVAPQIEDLNDYKFFCFNGNAKYLFVASDRNMPGEEVKFDYFDRGFNRLPMRQEAHPNSDYEIMKPEAYEEMLMMVDKLSVGIPQVRIDLYNINGRIYFGEYTFFHHGGFVPFIPDKYDYEWGEKLILPKA